jgi:hypothetical protein
MLRCIRDRLSINGGQERLFRKVHPPQNVQPQKSLPEISVGKQEEKDMSENPAGKQQEASQMPVASGTKATTTPQAKPVSKNSPPPPAPKKEPPPTPQNVQPQKSQPEIPPPKDGAGDKTGNQGENDSPSEELPFNASFESDEYGAVSFTDKAIMTTNDNDAGDRTLIITEGKWESSILADPNVKLKESMLIPALILAAFAIAGLAFGILNFIFGAKKKKLDQLNASICAVEKENTIPKNALRAAQRRRDEYPVDSETSNGV